ncbi:MAG: hypothetical protein RR840_04585 [Clostridium sp.]
MRGKDYKRFKDLAKITAVIVASTAILSGCGYSSSEEEEDEEDLYVRHNGSFIPYMLFMSNYAGKIGPGTSFATKMGDGNFKDYKVSESQMSSMKKGNFSGKVTRPVINKGTSSPTKSFGGSSSRSSGFGG